MSINSIFADVYAAGKDEKLMSPNMISFFKLKKYLFSLPFC
jgi:hypothetical protein